MTFTTGEEVARELGHLAAGLDALRATVQTQVERDREEHALVRADLARVGERVNLLARLAEHNAAAAEAARDAVSAAEQRQIEATRRLERRFDALSPDVDELKRARARALGVIAGIAGTSSVFGGLAGWAARYLWPGG